VLGKAEATAGRGPLVLLEGMEPLDIDAGRDDHRGRQFGAKDAPRLAQCVAAGGDHEAGAADHAGQQFGKTRQSGRHRHLGAVEDDRVRQAQSGADEADRQDGVEHDERGADLGGEPVDRPPDRRSRQQHRHVEPLDPASGVAIERRALGVGDGQHRELLGR
jgi:hypothetical protein